MNVATVAKSPLNQGSDNANEIVLFAPFSSATVVSLFVKTPSGVKLPPLMASPVSTELDLFSADGARYNAWSYTVEAPLTEFSGNLTVQFCIVTGGIKRTSSSVVLPVLRGVPYLDTATEADFNTVTAYLTAANQAAENSAKSVGEAAVSAGEAAKSATAAQLSKEEAAAILSRCVQRTDYDADTGVLSFYNGESDKPLYTLDLPLEYMIVGVEDIFENETYKIRFVFKNGERSKYITLDDTIKGFLKISDLERIVPRFSELDGEQGLNRVYYIDKGEAVKTTETSVAVPEGKSIIVAAFSDTCESDYSYLDESGAPTAPPMDYMYEGALKTPTVTVTDGIASWEPVEGAAYYKYIIGDVTSYDGEGHSFAYAQTRFYVEQSKERGVYPRYVMRASTSPVRDPDPEDFAAGVRLDSIPQRLRNGHILVPGTLDEYENPKEYAGQKGKFAVSMGVLEALLAKKVDRLSSHSERIKVYVELSRDRGVGSYFLEYYADPAKLTGDTIPQRLKDGSMQCEVVESRGDRTAANIGYVKIAADKKVDKVTHPGTGGTYAYVDANDSRGIHLRQLSKNVGNEDSIVTRRSGGRVAAGTPTAYDDAANKKYVDETTAALEADCKSREAALLEAISNIPKFQIVKADAMPEDLYAEDINLATLYLVRDASEQESYTEYVILEYEDAEGATVRVWESLGSLQANLTDYASKEELASGAVVPKTAKTAETAEYATSADYLGNATADSFLRWRGLNVINVDKTLGCWTVDISDPSSCGTLPTSEWCQVTQLSSQHFYTQFCRLATNDSTRVPEMWIRHCYGVSNENDNNPWTGWAKVLTSPVSTSGTFTLAGSASLALSNGLYAFIRNGHTYTMIVDDTASLCWSTHGGGTITEGYCLKYNPASKMLYFVFVSNGEEISESSTWKYYKIF